jgi:methionyl-tRNA formyltransferase
MLKTCFFGTSDRSAPILDALKENSGLLFCVTKSDTKIGRHQELKETGVKKWCKNNKIEVLEISNFKTDTSRRLIEQISHSKVDYIFVADFSFIVPKDFIVEIENKIINIHFSLLPLYRGASPVQYALLNGDNMTGISFLFLTKDIDRGNILSQYEYNIPTNATSGELIENLFEYASNKLPEFLKKLENGELSPFPQNEAEATYTTSKTKPKSTMVYKDDAFINWEDDVNFIERQVRAYSPWPISWTYLKYLENNYKVSYKKNTLLKEGKNGDLRVKIYGAEILSGKLSIKKIQVEGKKASNWDDFENGFLTR